jgi:type IV fimbrial biogenesis protein FimT
MRPVPMTSRRPAHPDGGPQRGFTLIELMIVLTVAGILASMAFPSFKYLAATSRTKNASSDLFLSLLRARSEAVKLNRTITLARTGAGWEEGWEIRDPDNTVLFEQGPLKGVSFKTDPSNLATIAYARSGRIQGTAPVFQITGKGWDNVHRCIQADTSGRPYVKAEPC